MRQAALHGLVLVDPFWRNQTHLEVHPNYDKNCILHNKRSKLASPLCLWREPDYLPNTPSFRMSA